MQEAMANIKEDLVTFLKIVQGDFKQTKNADETFTDFVR